MALTPEEILELQQLEAEESQSTGLSREEEQELAQLEQEEAQFADKPSEPGIIETIGQMGTHGLTAGFLDEIQGALRASGQSVENFFKGKPQRWKDDYLIARDKARRFQKAARKANPVTTAASEITGGVASTALAGPALNVAKGAGTAAKVLAAGKVGALYALGTTEKSLLDKKDQKALAYETGLMTGVGMVIPATVGAAKLSHRVGKGIQRHFTGLTPEEELGRKTLEFMGASKGTATALVDESPHIAKTIRDEKLITSRFDAVSKVWKKATDKAKEYGEKIKSIYSKFDDEIITEQEIADEIGKHADDLKGSAASRDINKSLISKLDNTRKSLSENKGILSPKEAWDERKIYDLNRAYRSAKPGSVQPQAPQPASVEHARIVRRSYQNVLNKRLQGRMSPKDYTAFQTMNEKYGTLSTIRYMSRSGQFTTKINPLSRLTIGAVIAGSRHPILAGGFLGAQSASKASLAPAQLRYSSNIPRPSLKSVPVNMYRQFNE